MQNRLENTILTIANTPAPAVSYGFSIGKEIGPGTILKDFDMLMSIVNEYKPILSDSGQIPLKMLFEINSRMSKPVKLGLTRPQLMSYPHIEALYILLRSSGLTTITMAGKKKVLAIDPQMLSEWLKLNDTERYCTLLEIWLLHSTPIINHPGSRINTDYIKHFYLEIKKEGKRIAGDKSEENLLTYRPGFISVALLELFGIIEIVHGVPQAGKGWCIESVSRTVFGDILMPCLLVDNFFNLPFEVEETRGFNEFSFDFMQPLLRPLFPEWEKCITIPSEPIRKGVFIFKITLLDCWRRIAIPSDCSLDDLADHILNSVDFDNDHLYSFKIINRLGAIVEVNHPEMQIAPFGNETSVGEIPLQIGQEMTFEFDFGDQWTFTILLEKIDQEMKINKSRCIETHGEAPVQYDSFDEQW